MMSWLEEQERILAIENTPHLEKMKSVKCYFFYINMNDYIDRIDMEELDITDDCLVGSDKVLHIIQSKKIYKINTKYLFKDLFFFHVDLEPDQIQGFVDDDDDVGNFSNRFFRKVSIVDDIVIPPSIGVFHSINCLYFFFYETLLRSPREPKSILKHSKNGNGNGNGKPTRRKHSNIGGANTRKVAWKTI